jgi:hypothetical protein
MRATWAFFLCACARTVSHALSPTARLTFSGFGLGISVVPCRLMGVGWGGFGVLNFRGSWVFLEVVFLGVLEAMFFELGAWSNVG